MSASTSTISDEGTRNKVANILADYGNRVQYSGFECRVDSVTLDEPVERLKPFPECADSIWVYQICEGCLKKAVLLGRGEFMEEVGFHII